MKKYLLLIFSMLSVSIGAWADAFGTNSSYTISGSTITVNIGRQNDMQSFPIIDLSGITKAIITGTIHCFTGGLYDANGFNSDGHLICSKFANLLVDFTDAHLVPIEQEENCPNTFVGYTIGNDAKNIIIPSGENPSTFKTYNLYTAGQENTDINYYSVSGSSINVAYNNLTILQNLNLVSNSATNLVVVKDIVGTIDLSTVASSSNSNITTIDLTSVTTTSSSSNGITAPRTATYIACASQGVADRISYSGEGSGVPQIVLTAISCTATELSDKVTALTTIGMKPTSITITGGEMDAAFLGQFDGANFNSVTNIDLSNATLATGASITDLKLPSTLTSLTLPKNSTVTGVLQSRVAACSGLNYVYSPTSDAGATVADYVYVVNAGGLAEAFNTESGLTTAVYIKVASATALNAADVNWNGLTTKPTSFGYVDFSDANITPELMFTNFSTPRSGDNQYDSSQNYDNAYRIIMPNNWSADDLACFGVLNAVRRGNKIAAAYSYTGTTLKVLGLTSNYSPSALADSRIVRSGTTAVEFVRGTYYNSAQGIFTPTMLDAVNNASQSSFTYTEPSTNESVTISSNSVGLGITSVKIATNTMNSFSGSEPYTLDFNNTTITNLDVTGLTSNSTYIVDADGCTALEHLYMDNVVIKSVTANCSTLKSVNMNSVNISGDVSFRNSALTSFTASGTINGNIDLSYTNKLGSVDIVNVDFGSTLGDNGESGEALGDLILVRQYSSTDVTAADDNYWNTVYVNGGDTYATISGKIKTSETFGNGSVSNGYIYPNNLTATATLPYSASVAGYQKDDCAVTLTLDGTTYDNSVTPAKDYRTLEGALLYIYGQDVTQDPCNLTINTIGDYKISAADITKINGLAFSTVAESAETLYRDATLNLDGAEFANGVKPTDIVNTSVHNIILPRDLGKDEVCIDGAFSGCTNLNAAVSLNAGRTAMVAYVKKPGTLRNTLLQVETFRPNFYNYSTSVLKDITLGGYLIACDVANGITYLDASGEYSSTGGASSSLSALDHGTPQTLDIENAMFVDLAKFNSDLQEIEEKPENMTLGALGWTNITSLKMSQKMTKIPANFLYLCKNLSYLCIPYRYTHIGNAAFQYTNLTHLTTTDSKGAEIDNGAFTYTLSANLQEIGTDPGTGNKLAEPVFNAYDSKLITDVYVLATTAPKCYRGAFAEGMTYGWGGFDPSNVYCRDKYTNNGFIYTLLHYPQQGTMSASDYAAMEKNYTDITRIYTKKDQTGALDANGDPIPWPTFAELCRAYNQAIRNRIWDDWKVGDDAVNGNPIGNVIMKDASVLPVGVSDDVTSSNTSGDRQHYDFHNYIGWHEFVLSKASYVAPEEETVKKNIVYRQYEQDGWYTFCIPFDMTRQQVIDLMGVPATVAGSVVTKVGGFTFNENNEETSGSYQTTALLPDIRTLKTVERKPGTTGKVTLTLSKNLNAGEYWNINLDNAENSDYATNGGDIIIRGGYPYLIKPYKLKNDAFTNLGRTVLSRYNFPLSQSTVTTARTDTYKEIGGNITNEASKFAKPYTNHKIHAKLDDNSSSYATYHDEETDEDVSYYYIFMGQYWRQPLPLNSYYMVNHTWYYYSRYTSSHYWNPYKCIITVGIKQYENGQKNSEWDDKWKTVIPVEVGKDSEGHAVFNQTMELRYTNGRDDSFEGSSSRAFNIVLDDGIMEFDSEGNVETAIKKLDNVDILPDNFRVYNLKGQYVGNSLNSLPSGMYIVNGKKIVID